MKSIFNAFSRKAHRQRKRRSIFRGLLWVGLSVTDAGLLCVWILGPVWRVIPEIAKKIWNSNWLERSRGRKEWGFTAKRDGRGQEADDQAHLLVPPPPPPSWTWSSCFVRFPLLLCSPLFPFLSSSVPPLCRSRSVSCLTCHWLTSNLSSQPLFQDYFKNLLPQSNSPWSSLENGEEVKGSVGEAD